MVRRSGRSCSCPAPIAQGSGHAVAQASTRHTAAPIAELTLAPAPDSPARRPACLAGAGAGDGNPIIDKRRGDVVDLGRRETLQISEAAIGGARLPIGR